MQGVKISNNLFSPSNVKCVTVNNYTPKGSQKNFINSLQNARNTLGCLERSLRKSNKYEQNLLHCKSSHSHSHDVNEWWDSDHSEEIFFMCSNTTSTSNTKSSAGRDDFTESWSTMSIVCLQYQYEELAKRYKSLLQAYDEQCNTVCLRDKSLAQCRQTANASHAHLAHALNALISVGEKYLALKNRRETQKSRYEDQLRSMRQTLFDVVDLTAQARLRFDARLAYYMANERDSDAALLLYEIRKCNLLFLENMRLKTLIEELDPGRIDWSKC